MTNEPQWRPSDTYPELSSPAPESLKGKADERPVESCAQCGKPRSNHHYRHPFQAQRVKSRQDVKATLPQTGGEAFGGLEHGDWPGYLHADDFRP